MPTEKLSEIAGYVTSTLDNCMQALPDTCYQPIYVATSRKLVHRLSHKQAKEWALYLAI